MTKILEEHRKLVKSRPVYVVCAAIHFDDGLVYVHQPSNIKTGMVVCGHRHHNIFNIPGLVHDNHKSKRTQGFLSSDNRFMSRTEANLVAFGAGQISEEFYNTKSELYSEDLY